MGLNFFGEGMFAGFLLVLIIIISYIVIREGDKK